MMRNRITIILLVLSPLFFSLTSCFNMSFSLNGDRLVTVEPADSTYVRASDSSATRVLEIGDFESIDVSHAFEIVFSPQVAEGTAELTAPVNLFDCIGSEVDDDGCLNVEYIRNVRLGSGIANPVLRLSSAEKFSSIDMTGATKVSSEDTLRLEDLEIEVSGASGIELALMADKLYIRTSGASGAVLEGSCKELGIKVSGASKTDAQSLKADYCDVECSGASKISVWCGKEIVLDCSGASKIDIYGPGVIAKQSVSGASSISKK